MICYITTSESSTDIILDDRKKEFVENNKRVCQENCVFSEYDYDIQKAKCSCDIVQSSSLFANIYIDKKKLSKNFIDVINIMNINLLKCYKVLLTKKGILYNYGSYFLIFIILFHFIFIIIFYGKNLYRKIKSKINDIYFAIKNIHLIEKE